MITSLTHIHSLLRWIILAMLLVSIIKAFSGKGRGKDFKLTDGKFFMLTMMLIHIQILVGIALYTMSPLIESAMKSKEGIMGDTINRFWVVEHGLGMLIATILITIGYSKSKKIVNTTKRYSTVAWTYLIALVIIFTSIPWPFRNLGVGTWF